MMQNSKVTKSRPSPQKSIVFSLLLCCASLAFLSINRIRDEQRREAIQAKYEARQVEINNLTRDIATTRKEMQKTTKLRKWTVEDKKHFDAVLKRLNLRLQKLRQS